MKRYPSTRAEWREMEVFCTDAELRIGGWQVMQKWEQPLMQVLARQVTANHGDILEVGFGMGISAEAVISYGCKSYTVIEAHPRVAGLAREWAARQDVPARVLEGFWEDILPTLDERFDGVLFDTYPLSDGERHKNHFAFIPHAPRLLRPNGIFTYYSDETVDFRQEHLKLLLTHFNQVTLLKVTGLQPPADCEYWQETYMIIPVAKLGHDE